jgi:hypothetical protein
MNLAEHDGKVYRVGGMRPQNAPGDPQDMRSLSDVARFDPALGEWEAIPPLPAPRSSHDVVVVDDTLVVVGGWNMRGADSVWAETMAVMDLAAFALEWRTIPQPFERRALIAAVKDGLMCVLGGMNSAGAIERTVSIYDVTAGTWTRGPDLPEGATSGFSPAACVVDGDAYVSFADGGLYRMNQDQTRWIRVGTATPRVAHRLVPHGESLLVVVGADSGENSDLIEVVSIDR